MSDINKYCRPFIKWVGGKTQLLDNIIKRMLKQLETKDDEGNKIIEMKNYHELFIGGGSLLFAILYLKETNKIKINGSINAYDINPILISLYKNIQSNKDDLLKNIEKYQKTYESIKQLKVSQKSERKASTEEEAKKSREAYYYWMRKQYNSITDNTSIEKTALFLILNKTCFRGLYREGPHGFNVPFGNYKTETLNLLNRKSIDYLSQLFEDVNFQCSDFRTSFTNIEENDFVYLDPPYAPENDKSFVNYVKDGFTLKDHKQLFALTKSLQDKKIKFVMSNSNVELVKNSFKNEDNDNDNHIIFKIDVIEAKRAINSKKPNSKTTEVLIYN